MITFSEVPDEVTLCLNISNCPCNCEGCHSKHLSEDIGEPLTEKALESLIKNNEGITCIAFMGGDSNPKEINKLAKYVKNLTDNKLRVAWYSGRDYIAKEIDLLYFNYIKIGPYIKEKGPLNSKTTNQKFYRVFHFNSGRCEVIDYTYKFWK